MTEREIKKLVRAVYDHAFAVGFDNGYLHGEGDGFAVVPDSSDVQWAIDACDINILDDNAWREV